MNKLNLIVSGLVALVVGAVVAVIVVHSIPITGGDFAGGITPMNLFTANTTANSVTPILSNLYVNGGISAGGVAANNQIPVIYTATAVYPGAASLSIATGTNFATTTQIGFTGSGFSVGDPCEVQYSFSTSTLFTTANVTAVSGSNVTTTASFLNTGAASITATVTSTVTGVSSTVKTTCFATGV